MKNSKAPVSRKSKDRRSLLDRILATPNLEQAVPRLQPGVLHRVVQSCGLESCGELLVHATPEQLAHLFDLDLWRSQEPGMDEQFDGERFGVWLEVLAEFGADVAAKKLSQIEPDVVIAGLAQHARVFDGAVVTPYRTTDGVELPGIREPEHGFSCDIGGYRLFAKATDSWEAIVEILTALDAKHGDYFHQVMRGCRSLSNSGRELDGLDDLLNERNQTMFDLAFDRERRRDEQGYVTPAQARAFLQMARGLRLDSNTASPANPVASNYPRSLVQTHEREGALRRIRKHMQHVCEHDQIAYAKRNEELTYLANTLMSGCALQGRAFTPHEAWQAAVAVCNLAFENWPARWNPPTVDLDLVTVFQVGWTVLHQQVGMYAAERLLSVLVGFRCSDRDIQRDLDALRAKLSRSCQAGTPWRARAALDVVAILDTPAWATLLGLIDECPVMHAVLCAPRNTRSVNPSAFEFISENSQILSIREFVHSLPKMLRP